MTPPMVLAVVTPPKDIPQAPASAPVVHPVAQSDAMRMVAEAEAQVRQLQERWAGDVVARLEALELEQARRSMPRFGLLARVVRFLAGVPS